MVMIGLGTGNTNQKKGPHKRPGVQKAFCATANQMEVRFNEKSNVTCDDVILLGHGMPRI